MYYYILYFGIARNEFTLTDFEFLLEQSRDRNKSMGITGKLLHCEGTFIQLLEGSEADVKAVYRSITNDERLIAIKTIAVGKVEERYYENWSMNFKTIEMEEINKLENCSHPNVSAYIKSASAIKLLKLLSKV